jgi:hypothetical protein
MMWALQHPSREAADVDMELIQSGVAAVIGELDLELQLILRDGLAAHRAGRTDLRPAPRTVGSSGWQLSRTDRFSGLRAQNLLVGHGGSPGFGRSGRAKCQEAGRLLRQPESPMEGSPTLLRIGGQRRLRGQRMRHAVGNVSSFCLARAPRRPNAAEFSG